MFIYSILRQGRYNNYLQTFKEREFYQPLEPSLKKSPLEQGLGPHRHNCQKVLDNIMMVRTVEIVYTVNREDILVKEIIIYVR
jgi:hypothetical protein